MTTVNASSNPYVAKGPEIPAGFLQQVSQIVGDANVLVGGPGFEKYARTMRSNVARSCI